jgi:predicted dithiol-disulfide oxidoreductase (DUF899 family)
MSDIAHPPITTRDAWEQARQELLLAEKELTRQRDRVNAARRRLPMVPVENYLFDSAQGEVRFVDLFAGQRQLIIYHFMFGPEWEVGCPVCTGYMNELCDLSPLAKRDTTFAIVAHAPIAKILDHKAKAGIRFPMYSAFGNTFNYDFAMSTPDGGEGQGMSVFFQLDGQVYHTYTTQQRGVEGLTSFDAFLDITPYGRQQDFEDSPAGWPQHPTYG